MELRYYKMPEGSPILALLGQKWVQNYWNYQPLGVSFY